MSRFRRRATRTGLNPGRKPVPSPPPGSARTAQTRTGSSGFFLSPRTPPGCRRGVVRGVPSSSSDARSGASRGSPGGVRKWGLVAPSGAPRRPGRDPAVYRSTGHSLGRRASRPGDPDGPDYRSTGHSSHAPPGRQPSGAGRRAPDSVRRPPSGHPGLARRSSGRPVDAPVHPGSTGHTFPGKANRRSVRSPGSTGHTCGDKGGCGPLFIPINRT